MKIVSVKIKQIDPKQSVIHTEFENGQQGMPFVYEHDRVSYTVEEVVGLTNVEYHTLTHAKEIEYMNSSHK